MRTILQRRRQSRDVPHSAYEERRLREVMQERCAGPCALRWPSSMMVTEDGPGKPMGRYCPDCADHWTTEQQATEDRRVSDLVAAHSPLPQPSLGGRSLHEAAVPWVRKMETAAGVAVTQNAPLGLVRSGSAKQLIVTGGGFDASDDFEYSTGITDSVAPVLTGTTIWTLTLVAGVTASPGNNHMAYNGHQYRGILRVG